MGRDGRRPLLAVMGWAWSGPEQRGRGLIAEKMIFSYFLNILISSDSCKMDIKL
jgi:hypothetical protein